MIGKDINREAYMIQKDINNFRHEELIDQLERNAGVPDMEVEMDTLQSS